MFSWFNRNNENTEDERSNLKKEDIEWQDNLSKKNYDEEDRSRVMNNNYKALFNKSANELNESIGEENKNRSPRDHFNNEALKATKDLLHDQTDKTKNLNDKDEIENTLHEESEKRKFWFW